MHAKTLSFAEQKIRWKNPRHIWRFGFQVLPFFSISEEESRSFFKEMINIIIIIIITLTEKES
jgi:hypothetical protein